eukprot:GHUV01034251.1.p1 GENE.GHUV01034251.1~~GHUV01034251.1.p1  ORF type:complete len:319 (+),score=64.45 GHUV01034251.1:357-1313(+)
MAQSLLRQSTKLLAQRFPSTFPAEAPISWPVQLTRALRTSRIARSSTATDSPAQADSLYDRPQLYDDAFSYRDFKAEVKFLLGAFQQHASNGGRLETALELGCGPANHAIQLAKHKVQTWALDANENMLEYADGKARAAGTQITTVLGDMTSFELQGMLGRLDMIVCLLGTLSHMLNNKQACACFQQVSRHLRPGGLFVLELAHPGDLYDGSLLLQDTGAEMWEVDKPDRSMMVVWGTDMDMFDPETQVLHRTVSIRSMKGEDMDQCLLEEVVPYRQFTTQEIDLLATMNDLEVRKNLRQRQTHRSRNACREVSTTGQ